MMLFEIHYDAKTKGAIIVYRSNFFLLNTEAMLDCIQDAVGELNELYREIENERIQEITNRKVDAAINAVKKIGKE